MNASGCGARFPPRTGAGRDSLEIVDPAALTLFEDTGRMGYAATGVSRSGAADRRALNAANRFLGNQSTAAALEILGGGFRARALLDLVCVVTGTRTVVSCAGVQHSSYEILRVRRGQELRIHYPQWGMRSYLAVRGGFDGISALGSRSTDLLSGLGPDPVVAGQLIPVANEVRGPIAESWHAAVGSPDGVASLWGQEESRWGQEESRWDARTGKLVLSASVAPGERWVETAELLHPQSSVVLSSRSNRIGTRLELTRPLVRRVPGELASEPTVRGAIQVPGSGQPIILGPDSPVTGGFPVVAVLTPVASDLLAQAKPGTNVQIKLSANGIAASN